MSRPSGPTPAPFVAPERSPRRIAAAAPRVVVIGDVILDGWWHGEVERMCREAPAPVFELGRRDEAPGGAANTALNAAKLGAGVRLLSVVGTDSAGGRLVRLLSAGGVDCDDVLAEADGTTTKSRIVAGDQILARVDEPATPPPRAALARLAARLPAALEAADAVLVCDYRLGVLTGTVRRTLIDALGARIGRRPLVVVDAHEPERWADLHPDLITPNAGEALRLLGGTAVDDRAAFLRRHRKRLLARTGARCVVVTLDRDGTLALPGSGFDLTAGLTAAAMPAPGAPGPGSEAAPREHVTWARPAGERQAAGAGDTFVACLTVALAAGLCAAAALDLAQSAADVVVHRTGTSVCSTDDLERHLRGRAATITDLDELAALLEQHRRRGVRIVLTDGCYDVLRPGHTRYLERSRQLGDLLVVAVDDDATVLRRKGRRPVNPLVDRVSVLGALGCVDHVIGVSPDTMVSVIERLRPDVYSAPSGADLTGKRRAVEAYGGTVAILDRMAERSPSAVAQPLRVAPEQPAGRGEQRPA